MTSRTTIYAVLFLVALTGAMGLWSGCGQDIGLVPDIFIEGVTLPSDPDTVVSPQSVGVSLSAVPQLVRVKYGCRTRDDAHFGIFAAADEADAPSVSGPTLWQSYQVGNQIYQWNGITWYRILAMYGTGRADVNDQSGMLTYTGLEKTCVSVGAFVPYLRSDSLGVCFDPDVELESAVSIPDNSKKVTIIIGQIYYLVVNGYVDWSAVPSGGINVYTDVDGIPTPIGTLLIVGGKPAIIFGPGLAAILQTFTADEVVSLYCYFDVGATRYYFTIWVEGTGPGGGQTGGTVVVYPEEVRS